MTEVLSITDYRRSGRSLAFGRHELSLILNVYSRRVMTGEWRDYAIDHQAGQALFSIFRNTHESPLFTIAKCQARGRSDPEYAVYEGRRCLSTGSDLRKTLKVLERPYLLVG